MRKSRIGKFIALMAVLWLASTNAVQAASPYATGTIGPDGRFVSTQTAYEPDGWIRLDVSQPGDLYYDDSTGTMYIADTGHGRIVADDGTNAAKLIGEGVLASPVGVYVAEGIVYVADYGLKQVVVFDSAGKLLKQIGRPVEPVFGKKNDFSPKKIAVDKRGNIYVISEGSIDGVIQLNNDGKFLGYIGANDTDLSLKTMIQRLIFTEEQRNQLFKSTPPSPGSIVLDQQGLLYTVTYGIESDAIKKLNVVGQNILPIRTYTSTELLDIDVDARGNIYTLDQSGWIDIYDSFGNLLFSFGGPDPKYERAGFVRNPTAIDVDLSGRMLFVADSDRGLINRYRITPFAEKVYEGGEYYKQGLYVESEGIWKDILKMNSFFILSYQALAKSYFKKGLDDEALESFKLAEDKEGYSDAFWNIRNEWLQNNLIDLVYLLIAILFLRFVLKVFRLQDVVSRPLTRLKGAAARWKLGSELRFVFYFLRHPIDAVYELKENRCATVRSATILYGWLLLLQIVLIYARGYLFGGGSQTNLMPLLMSTAVPLLFWVVMNYMVSTVGDGEGKFSEVYIGTIYALSPYLIFALPIALISNLLTYNEAFVYQYSMAIIEAWSVLLVIVTVKELHDFTVGQTIRNLFLTIFAIVIAALVLFILAFLFDQELDFIRAIIQELRYRA